MNDICWYACELHCHTLHSDGQFSVGELIRAAEERHLDGLCLTDHNTRSGVRETEGVSSPAVLPGMEWTTYHGHMLVLGCRQFVDWRDVRLDNIDDKMRAVREAGGLVGVAHPFQLGTPICTGGRWDFRVRNWALVNYLEVWSEGKPFLNFSNLRALGLWHSLLDRGFRIAPTFGRDWHGSSDELLPSACTYLGVPEGALTPEKMKAALQAGRTCVSAGPLLCLCADGRYVQGDSVPSGRAELCCTVELTRLSYFDGSRIAPRTVRLITNGGEPVSETPVTGGRTEENIFLESGRWYAAELWGRRDGEENTLLALTPPLYIV